MIQVTSEDLLKLEYLDKIFAGLNIDDLKILSEREDIVNRLKGTPSTSFIRMLACDFQNMQTTMINVTSELSIMKADMTTMLKMICNPYPNTGQFSYDQQNIQNLKSRYGIYN